MSDESLARYFDRCADEGVMDSFSSENEETLRRFMELWGIRPGERILEPGCGSGRLTARLADAAGPAGEVLALDISPRMIEEAWKRGLPPHVRFEVASAVEIPAPGGRFDKAVCFHVFPHFSDKPAALAEIARVLRPGGRLWINHLKGRAEINEFHSNAAQEVSAHQIPPEFEMRELLDAAGLTVVAFADSSDGYCVCAKATAHAPQIAPS